MKYCLTLLFLGLAAGAFAQQGFLFEQQNDVKIVIAGDTLMQPWLGGLNSPVFSTIDLNQDGTDDLYIFDRETNRSLTLLAANTSGGWQWKFAPQYENFFPETLENWVLLRDFDGDGKKDLFTINGSAELIAYKNITPAGGNLAFGSPRLLMDGTNTNFNPIVVSPNMLPAISDLDGDGDLDLLFFGGPNSEALLHYRNMSKDLFPVADSLWFNKAPQNWANVTRCLSSGNCHDYTFQNLSSCKVASANHYGSANILALDLDNDQDKDLLIGQELCNNLAQLTNNGTPAQASMSNASVHPVYPPNTTPAAVPNYPAAYSEDLNFDGKQDLIVSPFVENNLVDKLNMTKSAWFYKNVAASATGAPVFSFEQDNFLQDEMVELGEWARPVFTDIDGDGDQDLLIGNYTAAHNGKYSSTVHLFTNVGTATRPLFKLSDPDYLNFGSKNYKDIRLQFGDLNGDGSKDLILTYRNGQAYVDFIPNQALPNQPYQFSVASQVHLGVDVANDDNTFFYDLDGDGDLDLLLGTTATQTVYPVSGAVWYFKRVGADATKYQSWQLENANVGGIPKDYAHSDLHPFIIDMNNDGKPDLVTVANSGRLEVYPDVLPNLSSTFSAYSYTVLNKVNNRYEATRFGKNLYGAYADLDGDLRPEAIIGTRAGGVLYLQNRSTVLLGSKEKEIDKVPVLTLFPNPARANMQVVARESVMIRIFDVAGREVIPATGQFQPKHHLDLSKLQPGCYFLKATTRDLRSTGRTFMVSP